MTNSESRQSQQSLRPIPPESGASPSSDSSLPAAASQERSAEGAALQKFASEEPAYATSLPCETAEDIERISVLIAVSDLKSKNCANTTISVVGFAVDYGPLGESEEGEIIEGIRGHMLLDDGRSVFTTSAGVLKALRVGIKVYGRGLWNPPALLEIREVKAKRGDALIGVWRGRKGGKDVARKNKT